MPSPRLVLASPLLAIYLVADRRIVRADAGRWIRIHHGEPDPFNSPPGRLGEILYLLGKFPEYRTLFYFRASRSSHLGRILSYIARHFWWGAPGLLIGGGEIGPGLYIEHGHSTILAAERIGRDCWINQNVTLATNSDKGACVLGDRVYVRPGAVVLGGTHVGDDAEVGANAVVTRDVPPGKVAVGVPARVLRDTHRRAAASLSTRTRRR